MNAILKKVGVLTTMFVVGAGGAARAATIEVKVPFPFVVDGRTLPAGQYRVETEESVVVIHGEHGNRSALFVASAPAGGHDPSGDQPALTFTRDETQYKLAGVWESSSQGLAIAR